jgi:kynurenine formamidase
MPEDPFNATGIRFACHFGTHVDAPRHFLPDAPGIDAISLERLIGPGVIVPVDASADDLIGVSDLESADVRPGDIVALETGWWRHIDHDAYAHHPSLSLEAARWLVQRGVKLLAVDFLSPDLAHPLRGEGFDWPVHRILLTAGVLIAENVTNLAAVGPGRAEFMFLALPIAGADAAPARVIARPAGRGNGGPG